MLRKWRAGSLAWAHSGDGLVRRLVHPGAVLAGVLVVLLLTLLFFGSRPLWTATPQTSASDHATVTPRKVIAPDGSVQPEVPRAVPVDDPVAAAFAAEFVQQLMLAPGERERRRVLDLTVAAEQRESVVELVEKWLARSGSDGEQPLRQPAVVTLGYRVTARDSEGTRERITVLLWQEQTAAVHRTKTKRGVTYLLTRLIVERRNGELLVLAVDGVFPGPRPQPGQELFFRPVVVP